MDRTISSLSCVRFFHRWRTHLVRLTHSCKKTALHHAHCAWKWLENLANTDSCIHPCKERWYYWFTRTPWQFCITSRSLCLFSPVNRKLVLLLTQIFNWIKICAVFGKQLINPHAMAVGHYIMVIVPVKWFEFLLPRILEFICGKNRASALETVDQPACCGSCTIHYGHCASSVLCFWYDGSIVPRNGRTIFLIEILGFIRVKNGALCRIQLMNPDAMVVDVHRASCISRIGIVILLTRILGFICFKNRVSALDTINQHARYGCSCSIF